jgi:uncharacterized protein (TIGR00266 family)
MPTQKNNRDSVKKSKKKMHNSIPVEVAGSNSVGDKRFKFKYEVVNGPSFGSVLVNLKKGQKIVCQLGCMAHYQGNVKATTSSRGGIFSGIKRMILTSSSMFMTSYEAQDEINDICFQSNLPGDILPVVVRSGEKIIISPHSLVCFSDNLTLNSKRRLRGVFSNEGIYQSEFVNSTKEEGIVFLASYGGHQKIKLKTGEKLVLDNGLFLCSHTSTKYDITTVGGIKSTFLSGEGIMMRFTGPCELYTQGRSVHNLINFLSRHLPARS